MKQEKSIKNLDEYRGMVRGGFDVTYAYQNLDVIQEIIGNIKEDSNKPFITNDISIIKSKVHEILYNKDKFVVVLNRKDFLLIEATYTNILKWIYKKMILVR